MFAPPGFVAQQYVPTVHEETGRQDVYAAWAGGPEGVDTLNRLLEDIEVCLHLRTVRVLSLPLSEIPVPFAQTWIAPKGCFFLIAVQENNPQRIASVMAAKGFDVDVRHPGDFALVLI